MVLFVEPNIVGCVWSSKCHCCVHTVTFLSLRHQLHGIGVGFPCFIWPIFPKSEFSLLFFHLFKTLKKLLIDSWTDFFIVANGYFLSVVFAVFMKFWFNKECVVVLVDCQPEPVQRSSSDCTEKRNHMQTRLSAPDITSGMLLHSTYVHLSSTLVSPHALPFPSQPSFLSLWAPRKPSVVIFIMLRIGQQTDSNPSITREAHF